MTITLARCNDTPNCMWVRGHGGRCDPIPDWLEGLIRCLEDERDILALALDRCQSAADNTLQLTRHVPSEAKAATLSEIRMVANAALQSAYRLKGGLGRVEESCVNCGHSLMFHGMAGCDMCDERLEPSCKHFVSTDVKP